MWIYELDIEKNERLLREYGRAIILLTNLEHELKVLIFNKTTKKTEKELGSLIQDAKKWLPKGIEKRLYSLNEKRKVIVHGLVARFSNGRGKKETNMIIKIDKKTKVETIVPLTFRGLKKISESARKLIRDLINLRSR